MKKSIWKLARLSVLVLTGMTLLFIGCESEDSPDTDGLDEYFDNNPYVSDPRTTIDGDVSINPSSAQVTHIGQQLRFDARGGVAPYVWGVGRTDRGAVASAGGSQGVYTAILVEENSVIVSDANGHAAIAQVVLEPIEPLLVTADDSDLLNNGDQTTLRASGGTPPYTWQNNSGGCGGLDSVTGTSVAYTRLNNCPGTIVVMDFAGETASISIGTGP